MPFVNLNLPFIEPINDFGTQGFTTPFVETMSLLGLAPDGSAAASVSNEVIITQAEPVTGNIFTDNPPVVEDLEPVTIGERIDQTIETVTGNIDNTISGVSEDTGINPFILIAGSVLIFGAFGYRFLRKS